MGREHLNSYGVKLVKRPKTPPKKDLNFDSSVSKPIEHIMRNHKLTLAKLSKL